MKKIVKELIPYVIIVVVVILIRTFIATPVMVSGSSMYPNLKGKEILILYKLGKIDRYDVVVLNGLEDDHYIKRVYGLPGEKIKIEESKVYVNDKVITDEFSYGLTSDYEEITLGSDEYFVLGDNREVSLDSRKIGAIKKKNISGTSSLIIWPFSKFGIMK